MAFHFAYWLVPRQQRSNFEGAAMIRRFLWANEAQSHAMRPQLISLGMGLGPESFTAAPSLAAPTGE